MRAQFKDYHGILGVSDTADDVEIKKAFRRLARQFHPDVASDKDEAEERFKLINEAYEVLMGRDRRRGSYARGASTDWHGDFRASTGWRSNRRNRTGSENCHAGHNRFEETDSSRSFDTSFRFRNGRNSDPRGTEIEMLVTLDEMIHGSVRPIVLFQATACEPCGGSGCLDWQTCPSCNGTGTTVRTKTYQVKIPAGARPGQLFRFRTANGGAVNHSSVETILLRIRLAPHSVFRVENDALHCDLRVNSWTVLFGGTVSVPTPEGAVQINAPAGLRDGQRLRLRGCGLPGTGNSRDDLYVVVRITTVD